MLHCYAHLEQFRAHLLTGTTQIPVTENDMLFEMLVRASRRIDAECRRCFEPALEMREYDFQEVLKLRLDDDLLELLELATEQGETEIDLDDVFLVPDRGWPKYMIELDPDEDSEFTWSGSARKANQVTAIWGFHVDYDHAWQEGVDSVQDEGGLSDTATTVEVDDADGPDLWGVSPWCSRGSLLRIEDEFVRVTAVTTGEGGDSLTILRGQNGSEADDHAKDKAIDVWSPVYDIQTATLRMAQWLYQGRSAPFGMIARPGMGGYEVPGVLPEEIQAICKRYVRRVAVAL